jgi:ketosteroid isomerase-like protein
MDPKSTVSAALAAFNTHDLDRLMGYFAPDYHLVVHARQPFTLNSRDEARAVFAAEFAEAPDRRSEIDRLIADGTFVVVQCRDVLTHPTLGRLTVPIAMVFEVRDGVIVGCDYYQDPSFWLP